MTGPHSLNKPSQGVQDVSERLPSAWLGEKRNEIDWIAFIERNADLRVVLKSADTGAVTRARIYDDDGRTVLGRTMSFAGGFWRQYPQQNVVDRSSKSSCIQDCLALEIE